MDDFDRPLKKRGKRGACLIGGWLRDHQCVPDLVLSSPAERARATARKCCKSAGLDVDQIWWDDRLYMADAQTILNVLSTVPESQQRVMVVGHNPGLETLLLELLSVPPNVPSDGKLLPTATLVCLHLNDAWGNIQSHSATLQRVVRARHLEPEWQIP